MTTLPSFPFFRLALAISLACAAPACTETGGQDARRAVVVDLTDTVYVPTLRDFAAATPALVSATEALCADPTEDTLAAARDAWRKARPPWKRAEAFRFGPVVELRLVGSLDFWPLRVADVEDELARTTPITGDYIDGLGVTRRGFPVLEYILFGDLERLHDAGTATRACDYAVALARAIDRGAADLLAAWEPTGGDFRGALVAAGDDSDTYDRLSDAFDDLANAMFGAVAGIESMKLAKPLGKQDGDVPQPDAVESPYSDASIADVQDALAGVRAVYTASYGGVTGTASMSSLLAGVDPDLDAEILAQHDACDAAVAAIPAPLATAVNDAPAEVEAAFECAEELYRLYVADMAGALGVTPTFGDNDGD